MKRWLVPTAILCAACGTRSVPAPVVPDTSAPDSPSATEPYDMLVLSSDEPARVEHAGHTLCARTPCVVNLGPGGHRLELRSLDDDERLGATTVRGLREPSVVKQTMGEERRRGFETGIGYALVGLGALSFAAGVVWQDVEGISDPHCERNCGPDRTASTLLLTTGLLALIGGFALVIMDQSTSQPATTIQWTRGTAPVRRPAR